MDVPQRFRHIYVVHPCNKKLPPLHAHSMQPRFGIHSPCLHRHVCVSMCVPHSGCSPTHSSLGWPPLNPSPARSCCVAAGLNTAHCVSAPSWPQTVPTNVLLIRWLNYSCKNNVDISLKIAVCQILLANAGLQPLLSKSPSDPPHVSLLLPLWFLPYFSSSS